MHSTDDAALSAARGTGDRVVVSVAMPLEPEQLAQLRDIDPRIDLRYEQDLVAADVAMQDTTSTGTIRQTPQQGARWRAMLAESEVLFGLPDASPTGLAEAVKAAPKLRWIQTTAANAGELTAGLDSETRKRVAITGVKGIHATALAEFAMMSLLAFTKQLTRLRANQAAGAWESRPVTEICGRTMLVVGLGSTGAEVARLAKAFGMRVLAVNRLGQTDASYVDEVRTSRFLGDLLPVAHAVVLALPLTESTTGVIGVEAIRRMRSDAFVINVGSAGVVDEPALTAALTGGHIGGAALDVVASEPLPPSSPLWMLPTVLISPHTAALTVHDGTRIVGFFRDNLRRYLTGAELVGRVDPILGY